MNTDNYGKVTAGLPEGVYETKVEEYGFVKVCDLKQNDEVVFVEAEKTMVEITTFFRKIEELNILVDVRHTA